MTKIGHPTWLLALAVSQLTVLLLILTLPNKPGGLRGQSGSVLILLTLKVDRLIPFYCDTQYLDTLSPHHEDIQVQLDVEQDKEGSKSDKDE